MAAADAAAAAGKMVNASTSAKVAADINEERLRWLSPPAGSIITSEGGAFLAMDVPQNVRRHIWINRTD